MDELIAELIVVYKNYCIGIRELENFYNDLFGINASLFGPRHKSKPAAGSSPSEESGSVQVKVEPSAKPQQQHSKQGKRELAQEMEAGKKPESSPKKAEKEKYQNKQQAGQLRKTQIEFKEEMGIAMIPNLDMLEHFKTKDALENAKIQLRNQDEKMAQMQTQLKLLYRKLKSLKTKYRMERSAHKKTKEMLEKAERHRKLFEKKNQVENTPEQLNEKIKCLESELKTEQSAHQKTKEALVAVKRREQAAMNKLQVIQDAKPAEKEQPAEPGPDESATARQPATEEFHVQFWQKKGDKNNLKDKYKKEKAAHQDTRDELKQANVKMKGLAEKCNRLQSNEKKVKEGLLVCMSVIGEPSLLQEAVVALKKRYLDEDKHVSLADLCEEKYKREIADLKAKIESCTALLEASLTTKTKLEEKLSNVDNMYALREEKYVKLINVHIVLVQCLEKKLRNHISKCKNRVQEKICSWFSKNVQKSPVDIIYDNQRPLALFPHDWRLPGIPDEDLK